MDSNGLEKKMSNRFDAPIRGAQDDSVILGDMSLGERIKQARLAAELSQSQVADAVEVTVGAVSAWETGVAQGIRADTLFRLADLLRVSARWLATGEQSGVLAKDGVNTLAANLADLPLEKQKVVLDLIRALRATK